MPMRSYYMVKGNTMKYETEPLKFNVNLVFGDEDVSYGFIRELQDYRLPHEGYAVVIPINEDSAPSDDVHLGVYDEEDAEYSNDRGDYIYAEVVHSEEGIGQKMPRVILYGGDSIPDDYTLSLLEKIGWQSLANDDAQSIMKLVMESPDMAACHAALLVVGEVDSTNFQIWENTYEPIVKIIPSFGRRIVYDPVDSMVENLTFQVREDGMFYDMDIDLNEKGSLAKGVNALVIFSEHTQPGIADILYWVKDLGEITGFDLMSEGWNQLKIPEDFDPSILDIRERIQLASKVNTVSVRQSTEDYELNSELRDILDKQGGFEPDTIVVRSEIYEIEDGYKVSPTLYNLLPYTLVLKCRVGRVARGLSLDGDTGEDRFKEDDELYGRDSEGDYGF